MCRVWTLTGVPWSHSLWIRAHGTEGLVVPTGKGDNTERQIAQKATSSHRAGGMGQGRIPVIGPPAWQSSGSWLSDATGGIHMPPAAFSLLGAASQHKLPGDPGFQPLGQRAEPGVLRAGAGGSDLIHVHKEGPWSWGGADLRQRGRKPLL